MAKVVKWKKNCNLCWYNVSSQHDAATTCHYFGYGVFMVMWIKFYIIFYFNQTVFLCVIYPETLSPMCCVLNMPWNKLQQCIFSSLSSFIKARFMEYITNGCPHLMSGPRCIIVDVNHTESQFTNKVTHEGIWLH